MKLYRTRSGVFVEEGGISWRLPGSNWDDLISRDDLLDFLRSSVISSAEPAERRSIPLQEILAPVGRQEVWAAGVTYLRSREARKEEAQDAGGGDFYQRVYQAERPELFLKCPPGRAVGPDQPVRIRRDSSWSVPEPELTVVVAASGRIVGYTVGNDMSSRDIEGENPLYLPQAKIYERSCALGPCVLVCDRPLPDSTPIRLEVLRDGRAVIQDATSLSQMKRSPEELASYLFRELSFEAGVLLMTGTGIIPPSSFTLESGDEVRITIDPIGTLINRVE